MTQADYQSFSKARAYYYPNLKYYPSDNYTYCSALDATCQLCKQKWIQDYYTFGNTPAIPFCTGAGGCVCVAYCELPGWTDTVLGNQCSSSGGITDIDSPKLFGSVGLTIGFVVLFLAVVVGARFVMQRLHWNGASFLPLSSFLLLLDGVDTASDVLPLPVCRREPESGSATPRAVGAAAQPQRMEVDAREAHRV